MPKTVFYAWQSQLPGKANRYLIEEAVKKALVDAATDVVLDQDARGAVGAVEISATILKKIDDCQVFVADVTPVGVIGDNRPTPNPNVLFELGYAWHGLGESRVIMVLNEAFGSPEDLPFDISKRTLVRYRYSPEGEAGSAEVRAHLASRLRPLLAAMLADDHLRPLRDAGLRDTDIGVFNACYGVMVETDRSICEYETILEKAAPLGIEDALVEDAVQVVAAAGFWEAHEIMGDHRYSHVSATQRGMEQYLLSGLPGYVDLRDRVARLLLGGGMNESVDIKQAVAQPAIVVEHVLEILASNDYIKTVAWAGGMTVSEVLPKLRRAFEKSG